MAVDKCEEKAIRGARSVHARLKFGTLAASGHRFFIDWKATMLIQRAVSV
jgi:Sel1 repeat